MPTLPLYPKPLHLSHPLGRKKTALSIGGGSAPLREVLIFSSASAGSAYFSLQLSHNRLTRRWAMIIFKLSARDPGSAPKSINRGIAPAASLVCRVEKTKWPVKDASSAVLHVSE